MDQEKDIVKPGDALMVEEDRVTLDEDGVGDEGDIASSYSDMTKDRELEEIEFSDVSSETGINNGDASDMMKYQNVSNCTLHGYPGDTSLSRKRSLDEEEIFSDIQKYEITDNELVENMDENYIGGGGTASDICLQSDEFENRSAVKTGTDECSSKVEKSIDGSWSEAGQECSESVEDENLSEKGNEIVYQENDCIFRADSSLIQIVNSETHDGMCMQDIPEQECEGNVQANRMEGSMTQVQEIEVIGLRGEEAKDDVSEQEKIAEEIGKDTQRPRSRTYPFKVLVSGLPLGAKREDIMCYFSQFGEVLRMWEEGRHRANVLFADEESYKKAVFSPDPYFDDHKLLIRSLNETVTIISDIPRSIPAKDAEIALMSELEEAGVTPCRITVPPIDPTESTEGKVNQGYAVVAFADPQTYQKADDLQNNNPFVVADSPLRMYPTCNEFYDKFCIRVYPLPSEQQRTVVYHHIHATFTSVGEIVAISIQYVGNSMTYAGYIMFESEDSVKKAKEMDDVKILGEFVHVQDFHPFEQGHGFRHLWLKVHNLPPRATITEIKHHFGHDKGILNIELDLDFGSCYIHINSESALQRCLRMHQTYLRGKCLAILIAEDNPEKIFQREISKRGRRPNFRNSTGRKKSNNASNGFSGKTFTSATQPQGNQDRRGYERGDRKFSKSRSNVSHSKESSKAVKGDGDGVKIADSPAV